MVGAIFSSVFIHRSKDFNDDIRLHCLQHIQSFLLCDLSLPIKTEYLKYLGWACYDPNKNIRHEAVAIIEVLVNVSQSLPPLRPLSVCHMLTLSLSLSLSLRMTILSLTYKILSNISLNVSLPWQQLISIVMFPFK